MSIQEISVAFGLVVGVLIINPSHAAVENEYSAQIPTRTLHIPAKILGDYEIYDSEANSTREAAPRPRAGRLRRYPALGRGAASLVEFASESYIS